MNDEKYELVKFEDNNFSLDVKVSPEEDTVWLTQNEIAYLFDTTKQNISLHIKNIYKEGELDETETVKNFFTVQKEGNKSVNRMLRNYNLDVILSIGYRLKSKRGNIFRQWSNKILKEYLFYGYSINQKRVLDYQANILMLEANVHNIENRIKNIEQVIYADNNQIIFEGEIIKPYSFIIKLFYLAKNEIIIIDEYADQFVLDMLSGIKVKVKIYTNEESYINKCELSSNITIINTNKFHDRFIVIDKIMYSLGTSINSIGKKRFFINKIEDIPVDILLKDI